VRNLRLHPCLASSGRRPARSSHGNATSMQPQPQSHALLSQAPPHAAIAPCAASASDPQAHARAVRGTGPAVPWHWAGRTRALGRPYHGTGPAVPWHTPRAVSSGPADDAGDHVEGPGRARRRRLHRPAASQVHAASRRAGQAFRRDGIRRRLATSAAASNVCACPDVCARMRAGFLPACKARIGSMWRG
jgi:hypothetical protein